MKRFLAALLFAAAIPAAPGAAQVTTQLTQAISGTRLDVSASGEVTRVPDIAMISAGVVTRSTTAAGAMQENSARMERVIAALKRAGLADRDMQTSSINLNPEYRGKPAAAAGRLQRLQPGHHPLSGHPQQRQDP